MAKMKQPKCEDMWAVFNPEIGFYIGTWLTRQEAKHYHAQNTTQNGDWESCKKRGDIVMRVQISAAQPRVRADGFDAALEKRIQPDCDMPGDGYP